ncbi:TipAS antibiotic-recognition domain-containing protein, partial [Ruminococcaceae bacterium OttesenSCG-928-D13]|nr:TipAS antibiotic-recognition domain-containing protein [Ruminococcaceae bacterium OttesenSCG-928-D13]
GNPAGPAAQQAAELHRQWLSRTWGEGKYSGEAHKNLAQMYVDDERFAAYYEKAAPGAAVMLRDAIAVYVDKQDQ